MVRRRKRVSEKSLELNVGAELLNCIRSWPNCQKALWFGLTQSQESRKGLDEFVLNVPRGFLLMLQFKAPRATPDDSEPYRFDINVKQHQVLFDLASRFQKNVFYVFPLYREWSKAGQDSPDLARDTWLMPVYSMPPSLRNVNQTSRNSSCRVEVERQVPNIDVWFKLDKVGNKACSVQQLCSKAATLSVPKSQLEEWVQESNRAPVNLRSRTSPFRGLSAIFVP